MNQGWLHEERWFKLLEEFASIRLVFETHTHKAYTYIYIYMFMYNYMLPQHDYHTK